MKHISIANVKAFVLIFIFITNSVKYYSIIRLQRYEFFTFETNNSYLLTLFWRYSKL